MTDLEQSLTAIGEIIERGQRPTPWQRVDAIIKREANEAYHDWRDTEPQEATAEQMVREADAVDNVLLELCKDDAAADVLLAEAVSEMEPGPWPSVASAALNYDDTTTGNIINDACRCYIEKLLCKEIADIDPRLED